LIKMDITLETLKKFFKEETDATRAMLMFDKENGVKAGWSEVFEAVKLVVTSRQQLVDTLHDKQNAAKIVVRVFEALFWIAMLFVVLLILGYQPTAILLPLGTAFLGLSFVFGNSVKTVFESFIFIFVVRPFDVGDKILSPKDDSTITVSQINLLTTVFYSSDGKMLIFPNSYLAQQPLVSLKRSKSYCIAQSFTVEPSTSPKKINNLKSRIFHYLKNDTKIRWDLPDSGMWVTGCQPNQFLKITFG